MSMKGTLNKISALSPSFYEFWVDVAEQLGDHRLQVCKNAKSVSSFIAHNSDHKAFLYDAIQETYRRCRCHNLYSPLNMDSVLDVLGETAFTLRGDHQDELFDIELLEEIAWYISQRHLTSIESLAHSQPEQLNSALSSHPSKKNVQVKSKPISFPSYKIRLANQKT